MIPRSEFITTGIDRGGSPEIDDGEFCAARVSVQATSAI
jgi:hypothetical protein